MTLDLVLRGGRIIDPSQRLDEVSDIGFADGKVAGEGTLVAATAIATLATIVVPSGSSI